MGIFANWIEALAPTLDPNQMAKYANQIVMKAKEFVTSKLDGNYSGGVFTIDIGFLDFNNEQKTARTIVRFSLAKWGQNENKLGTDLYQYSGRSTNDADGKKVVQVNIMFNKNLFDRAESPKAPRSNWGFEDDGEESEEDYKKHAQYQQQSKQHDHSGKLLNSLVLKKFRQQEQQMSKRILFLLTHELGHSQRPFGKTLTGKEDNYDQARKKGWNKYQSHPREVEANLAAVKSKYMSIPANARRNITFEQLLRSSLNPAVVQTYLRSPEARQKLMSRFAREGIYTKEMIR